MGANAFEYNVKLNLNADTSLARTQISSLQQQLTSISNLKFNFNGINALTSEINEASNAALKLQTNLQAALNPNTGNLDFSKFTASIQRSGDSLQDLSSSLLSIGPQGTKAFISLADSISRSEVPLVRTNKLVNGLWDNLKKTAGWQISSSVIHGLMGSVQQAMGYAQALDKSLTDIRIVTGQSAEQMARFAKEANKAAKQLSATTTDYTNASLIYYQQGLSDAEVKKRSEITIKMANATGASTEKVSNQMTAIWNNFADGTKSLEHYADVMTALGAATASSTDEIAKGLQKFASISDTVGLSYEYAASALATITATTRESADTVGNSLKTLFSRIQGLQLGETLDDGTTLNKYSTALAKVGISIKDASGQLKDMDVILDDMGTKWHTLAEDQKMALAQTVGGVRQYTQIMTLMENWDFFKENLTTASTSTGALAQQAAIYADSWEAAQKRMKASWETMWDSLIDSDSFKKILNIGSTIVENLGKAFAGLGGTGGVLGSAFSVFGNLFKDQLSSAVGDGIYNLTHMTPKARNAAMDERTRVVQSMANTIRDPSYNPGMGDAQREIIANQIESQAQQRIAYAQNSRYMNSQDIALYSELDKRVQTTRESRRQIAEQIDAGSMLIAHGRYADESDVERFTRDYVTPGPQYGSVKSAKERARIDQTQQFGWALTQEQSLMFNAAGERVHTSAAALGDVLEVLGERSAVAGQDIEKMTSWLASGQRRTAEDIKNNQEGTEFTVENLYQKTGKGYSGTAYEMYRDLLGITQEESAKINSGNLEKGTREYALNEVLSKELKGLQGVIDSSKGMTESERAQAISGYLQKSIAGIESKALAGLGVSTSKDASVRRGGTQIFTGAKQRKEGQLKDQPLKVSEEKDAEAMAQLAQKRIDMGRTVTSGLLGISGTASGLAGLEGAFSSLLNGNIAGAATGIGSAAMNFRMANQNYTEMFSGFKNIVSDKQMEKANLLIKQKDLQNFKTDYEDASDQYFDITERLKSKDLTAEERQSLLSQQSMLKTYLDNNKKAYKQSDKNLRNVEKSLKPLESVDVGKSPETLSKVGNGLKTIAANAQAFATAVQVATVTFKAVNSALTYVADTNKRNAENSNKAATQLQSAYAMNQNNHNALLSSIEKYDKAIEKVTDSNLKGAEKQAAIYEQNSIAADLISQYGITEFDESGNRNYTRTGDILKISDKALEAAKEQSISNMAISKYAAERAKVDAKIASNEYNEEALERKMGMNEDGWFTGAALGAGVAAGAGTAALLGSAAVAAVMGPIGWAALIAAGVLGAAGVGNMVQRDSSIVDEAVAISQAQGSMLWLDNAKAGQNIEGKTFTQAELDKLRKNRDEIQKLIDGEAAANLQNQLIAENTARDIINTNEETKDFKYADKLIEGIVRQQEDWYEDKNNYNGWDTSKAKISAAKAIEDELGLTGKNVVWSDDNKNGRLTYTYTENGQQQTGELSYDSLETMEATKKGKQETDKYVSQMIETYEDLKGEYGETAAAGLLSFISGGNFDSATLGEMKEAQDVIKNLTGSYFGTEKKLSEMTDWELSNLTESDYKNIAKLMGIEVGDNQSAFQAIVDHAQTKNTTIGGLISSFIDTAEMSSPIENLMMQYAGGTKIGENGEEIKVKGIYEDWFASGTGKQIYESMSQATMTNFYKQLSMMGTDQGRAYLNSLSGILEGVDPDKIGSVMQALTNVDWSDWNGLKTQVIDVLDSFDIKIENVSEHLDSLVHIARMTANAIPAITDAFTSLTQAASTLSNLEIGKSIDDATMQALKEQNINLDKQTFSTIGGENVIIGDTEQSYEEIRAEVADTYNRYTDVRNKAEAGFRHMSETDRNAALTRVSNMTEEEFLDAYLLDDDTGRYNDSAPVTISNRVLTADERTDFFNDRQRRIALDNELAKYKEVNGEIFVSDGNGGWVAANASQQVTYNELRIERQAVGDRLSAVYQTVTGAAAAALDPAEMQKLAEQYVSTFSSFEEAMNDPTVQKMIQEGDLSKSDALMYYASQYPTLIDDINAYNAAVLAGNDALAQRIEKEIELGVAVQDSIRAYKNATGKEIGTEDLESAKETLRSKLSEETVTKDGVTMTKDQMYSEAELTRLATESLIAGYAENILKSQGDTWISQIENMKPDDAQSGATGREAAAKLGKNMQQLLGLTEYDITNIGDATENNPIIKAIQDGVADLSKVISGDTAEAAKLRLYLIKNSVQGQNLTQKLNINKNGYASVSGYDDPNLVQKQKYNRMVNETKEGDEAGFEDAAMEFAATTSDWEEFSTGVSMASGGTRRALESGTSLFTVTNKDGTTTTTKRNFYWDDNANGEGKGGYMVESGIDKETGLMQYTAYNENDHGTGEVTTAEEGEKIYTGGGGGGGGGGGPTEVAVKSAQELMTRYKTIDAKSAIAEMQKATALTQKDLLYGEAKIAQLQKINGLLVKQQRLTADRIEEERQYLAEDKKHLQEVLDRYNKDKKDADGNVKEGEELLEFQFNSEGLITNYKQTIGVMAEELAAMYRDGELTAEEGKKAEELQKKIADLNVVIQDYEDSLNQLQTSIDTYEQTLYEMFANQAEELAYKVTYKLEMENDDLSYVKFYATALKDSMGRISDYIELTGYQVNELYDQINVYNQGVMDLMDNAANNPMYMWATKGMEGTLTAEDITNLRTYRDGLSSVYSSLTALRKDVEEKVLKVFDEWHDKVNKNIEAISRYTDMLSQFKDIINIVGKEALGLSDAFMKTFEQQSIDQSKDNIEAAKKQYESLAEIYAEAQMNLEAARASGNEDSIKHWEEVVNKTRSEMEGAQDAMLTTLQHTLNMVAEQFTNAVTTAMDNFNESIYSYNGLDGLIADYERINEQQDLMVADYEKIYSLNKLNRQLEKTLDDTKLIAGKQKLLEFQQKINDINKSNVELSKYELEYLQAEYDLRLAEIELENARNSKDTVRLSRDSEGNWSYIYTQNESAVDEAQQKYEDALFKMQQLSQDYTKEMSASMMEITQAMRDEIAELSIQDFATPEEYYQAIQEIENRYSEQLAHREAELNKSIANSADLYNQDWQNYSDATGYKLSSAEDWTDRFSETTLGTLTGSGSYMSDYSTMIAESTNQLTGELVNAATTYFTNANSALETYGTSLQGFAGTVTSTTSQITASSKQATVDVTNMATDMVDAFSTVADEVRSWQINFGDEISDLLEDIGAKIKEINDIIKQANEMGKQNYSSTDLIGEKEAIKLLGQETFNNADLFGTWNYDEETGVTRGTYTDAKGKVQENVERNLVEFTGQLVEMIDELTGKYYEAETGSPEREAYGKELKKLFQDYWKFKNIINRIYDLTDISMPEPKLDEDEVEGLASGGYTGEWGSEGKLAFLHEKELVLNADDTANFLQALQISRQLVEMIEMNARQSSLGLGEMHASTIQDTAQTIEQQVSITAEFPNAVDHSEIEEAFDNLINMASQYAYRN